MKKTKHHSLTLLLWIFMLGFSACAKETPPETPTEPLPVVYATNAGWASTLDAHFEKAAEERWGYEVIGVIKGSLWIWARR